MMLKAPTPRHTRLIGRHNKMCTAWHTAPQLAMKGMVLHDTRHASPAGVPCALPLQTARRWYWTGALLIGAAFFAALAAHARVAVMVQLLRWLRSACAGQWWPERGAHSERRGIAAGCQFFGLAPAVDVYLNVAWTCQRNPVATGGAQTYRSARAAQDC